MKFDAWVRVGVCKVDLGRGISPRPPLIHSCSILFLNAKGISFHSPFCHFSFFFFCLSKSSFWKARGLSKCDRFLESVSSRPPF